MDVSYQYLDDDALRALLEIQSRNLSHLVRQAAASGPLGTSVSNVNQVVEIQKTIAEIEREILRRKNSLGNSDTALDKSQELKIGLIGGRASGKSTFLAVLQIAALTNPSIDIKVSGLDYQSTDFLIGNTDQMLKGQFPAPTIPIPSLDIFGFRVRITQNPYRQELFNRLTTESKHTGFNLYINDVSGEQLLYDEHEQWEYFAQCDGLIYCFSHDLEDEYRYNFRSLNKSTSHIFRIIEQQNGLLNDKFLPQYLAVCSMKFDNVLNKYNIDHLFKMSNNVIYINSSKIPLDKLAPDNLSQLIINKYFHPSRVRYFATSSIGFFVDKTRGFDPNDCCNFQYIQSQENSLRGEITPVNVWEPILWIEGQKQKQ